MKTAKTKPPVLVVELTRKNVDALAVKAALAIFAYPAGSVLPKKTQCRLLKVGRTALGAIGIKAPARKNRKAKR